MQDVAFQTETEPPPPGHGWRVRLIVSLLVLVAIATVLVTNRWMSERFTEATRSRAEQIGRAHV